MSTLSARDRKVPVATMQEQQSNAITAPITVSESSALILALARIFTGYLWFQQLYWKLPPDFA